MFFRVTASAFLSVILSVSFYSASFKVFSVGDTAFSGKTTSNDFQFCNGRIFFETNTKECYLNPYRAISIRPPFHSELESLDINEDKKVKPGQCECLLRTAREFNNQHLYTSQMKLGNSTIATWYCSSLECLPYPRTTTM